LILLLESEGRWRGWGRLRELEAWGWWGRGSNAESGLGNAFAKVAILINSHLVFTSTLVLLTAGNGIVTVICVPAGLGGEVLEPARLHHPRVNTLIIGTSTRFISSTFTNLDTILDRVALSGKLL